MRSFSLIGTDATKPANQRSRLDSARARADKRCMNLDEPFYDYLMMLRTRIEAPTEEEIRRQLPRIERFLESKSDLNTYLGTILNIFELNLWSGWFGRDRSEIDPAICKIHQIRLLRLAADDLLALMSDPAYRYDPPEQPPVSVIIPAWNQWAFTRDTLATMFSKTVWPEYEVVVIDNGSEDDTPRELARLAPSERRLRVIRNGRNLGFSEANNQGVAAARFEHLIFLNNDVLIHSPDWIGQLMRSFLVHPRIGATGQFGVLDCFDGEREEYYQKVFFPAYSLPLSWVSGFNLLTTRRALRDAGGWRGDLYGVAGYEDIHLGYAMRQAGWIPVSPCELPVIEHLIGQTRFTDAGRAFVAANSPCEDKHKIFCRFFGSRQFRPAA